MLSFTEDKNIKTFVVSTSELHEWELNPREIKTAGLGRLKKQIEKLGVYKPLLITSDGTVIGGNMRLRALKELNKELVWVSLIEFKQEGKMWTALINGEKQQGEYKSLESAMMDYSLSDNDRAGYYDKDKMQSILPSLDVEMDYYSIDTAPATSLADVFDRLMKTSEDAVPEPAESDIKSKLGEVYILGRHRLMCGDATVATDVEKLLNGAKPNLMVTDPPYGVDYDPMWREGVDLGVGKRSKGKVINDTKIDWSDAFSLFTGDVAYVWHAGKYTDIVAEGLRKCGFEIVNQIIWVKQHFVISRGDYHWQHEPCWYAVKTGKNHNWQGARDQTSVWEIKNNNRFGNANSEETWGHGTQKPVELISISIKNNSKPSDEVYDPFGGSGTTLIACEQLNRTCLTMELDPKYCDLIRKRYAKFVGKDTDWGGGRLMSKELWRLILVLMISGLIATLSYVMLLYASVVYWSSVWPKGF